MPRQSHAASWICDTLLQHGIPLAQQTAAALASLLRAPHPRSHLALFPGCGVCVQTKGTQSFGMRHNKTHVVCRRCGKTTLHVQKGTCSSCGFPAAKIRSCKSLRPEPPCTSSLLTAAVRSSSSSSSSALKSCSCFVLLPCSRSLQPNAGCCGAAACAAAVVVVAVVAVCCLCDPCSMACAPQHWCLSQLYHAVLLSPFQPPSQGASN